jgi:hypothetical protein
MRAGRAVVLAAMLLGVQAARGGDLVSPSAVRLVPRHGRARTLRLAVRGCGRIA